MVMSTSWSELQLHADTDSRYDGVVYVSNRQEYIAGSGALLFDGRAILTAAHVVRHAPSGDIEVRFETAAGVVWRKATQVIIDPSYDATNSLHDAALIILDQPAPAAADRYHLYRSNDELGKTFTMVGYGDIGTGTTGAMSQSTPYRHDAQNTFDTTATQLKNALESAMAWTPHGDMTLVADFDDGSVAHDALGRLMGLYNTGLGAAEGLIAPGDSGGPAFINGQIAGVASYVTSLAKAGITPDVTPYRTDASFGEIAAWTRVSNEQQFIDQALRQSWTDAPHAPAQVKTVITEGNAGQITTAWFLVNYSGTVTADQPVEVKYTTLDGTATAGQDYIATQGTLVFYPGEQAVPIPVEIIGDDIPESNETFYLKIYDPVGGTFPDGATELIGMRTIQDNDAAL
ncbi:Trypsin [Sulfurivirga caldicuralii]|uniref:Trypsin n=2 Tax=Sulfurivirga caldicuralii TaxID=364032 RepID=A0A1N6HGU1_9GAMM|nr:Trypsin [Sulfurivirga caldicuralii]